MPGTLHLVVAGVLLLAATLAGCTQATEPVRVVAPTLEPSDREPCAKVADNVPEALGEDKRRSTRPPLGVVAAWGDPPVVLRCGVDRPAAYRPGSQVIEVEGVAWFAEPAGDVTTFTSVDRPVYVEVTVPASRPADAVLVELAPALQAVPETVSAGP